MAGVVSRTLLSCLASYGGQAEEVARRWLRFCPGAAGIRFRRVSMRRGGGAAGKPVAGIDGGRGNGRSLS